MIDVGSGFMTPVLTEVRAALTDDIRRNWPGAKIVHLMEGEDGHQFWIEAPGGSHHRLLLGHRAEWFARMRDDTDGLIDALRAQRWMDFLLLHGCGYLTLYEDNYILRTCP